MQTPTRPPRRAAAALRSWALASAALTLGTAPIRAQDQVRNYTDPILVLDTGGHSSQVRALLPLPGGEKVLSAGLDKTIYLWDFAADRGPERSLKPPIFRGLRGAVQAMALGAPDKHGQRVLAVGGFGIDSRNGQILLFRYPGLGEAKTGDLFGILSSGERGAGPTTGHTNAVFAMSFDPSGKLLATASADGTARLWDVEARKSLAVFGTEGGPAVNALAFSPDGRILATGGEDGILRLWDVTPAGLARPNPKGPSAIAPPKIRREDGGSAINALAISPDGKFVVIGREDGLLSRFSLNAPDLAASESPMTIGAQQAAVEALAFDARGRLAVSSLAYRVAPGGQFAREVPKTACDVEIRALPGGEVVRKLFSSTNPVPNPIPNLVRALAFAPEGDVLFLGGGDAQGIWRVDLRDAAPAASARERKGKGRTIWEVGFSADGAKVAFARVNRTLGPPAASFETFDLTARLLDTLPRAAVSGPVLAFNGFTVRPVDQYTLDVVDPQNRGVRIALDRLLNRRWWAWTFLPPKPGHDLPLLAVACEAGISIHRIDTGARTRFLAGHSGPVLAVAPSPDGKWLASGSSDQTVRLWTLAGADTLPKLGATFEGPLGAKKVTRIEARSPAEGMGLEIGDVVRKYGLGRDVVTEEAFFAPVDGVPKHDTLPPDTRVELIVSRTIKLPFGWTIDDPAVPVGTSRRDSPALSLFAFDEGREWVLWMPKGFYDTSIDGDAYLAWHLNRAGLNNPKPTDILPIRTFEAQLRQKKDVPGNVLNTLIRTGDVALALGARPAVLPEPQELIARIAPPRPVLFRAPPPPGLPAAPAPVAENVGAAQPVDTGAPLPAGTIRLAAGSPLDVAVRTEGPAGSPAVQSVSILIDGQILKTYDPRDPQAAPP